ncbi:MAG TPA: hypothetical protein VIH42_11140 [Thermoguttaceae bacterium]
MRTESALKKTGSGKENDVAPGLHLFGYSVLLIVNLIISAPVSAASFTGLAELSGSGFSIKAPVFSADLSKTLGFNLTSVTLADSLNTSAEALKVAAFGNHPRDQHEAGIAIPSLMPVPSMVWPILASALLALLGVEPRRRSSR